MCLWMRKIAGIGDPSHVPVMLEDLNLAAGEGEGPARSSAVQRPQGIRNQPARLNDFPMFPDNFVTDEGDLVHLALFADCEPINHEEALNHEVWQNAMKEEMKAIEKNATWELVELPQKKQPIAVKWIFKVKHRPDGSIANHKARLVARGFLQKAGLDYSEVFALVARL